ncbi:hypothetical protein ACFO0N_08040 [Halobium salinum]|uniref:Uncharacterized protein n=1 Tax=Halobium salinum TaxID=1364940 RepID=A0ABD5PAZ4_9EURY|nr:hypothetical protein [Halobium salinum]
MKDFSKRQYLKYAGAGLAAASLGIGGTVGSGALSSVEGATSSGGAAPQNGRPSSGDRLDYERVGNDIEFDYLDVSFESDDGDIELNDIDLDFETDGDSLELTINTGSASVDLEMDDNGASVELTISVGSEYIDFESDGNDVEFEAIGTSETFEDDNNEIEYKGDSLQFEWDADSQELDITGDVSLELKTDGSADLDFEYQDDDFMIDYDTTELEYMGPDVSLEWENGDGDDDEFEARRM